MRTLFGLLIASTVILTACAAPRPATSVAAGIQPTAEEASVPAGLDPVQTAHQLLEAGDWRWLDAPNPLIVRQMSYSEAHKWLPMLSNEGYGTWGPGTSMWFVVFKGRWGTTDPQAVNYEGCLFVLFTANEGRLVATGTTHCPGEQ